MAVKQSREARREQIVEAALELLARQGIKRLSVGAVARRIGVVPSAVYRHFRGKEEILSAAVGRMGDRLLENVLKAGSAEENAVERLRRILGFHVNPIRFRGGEADGAVRVSGNNDVVTGGRERF